MSREVVSTAARTTTGNSGGINIAATGGVGREIPDTMSLWIDITAASGTTPTLDLTVEWSMDGTNFVTPEVGADSFTQKTTTGQHLKQFTVLAQYYRIVWTIGGTTPSFTFTVSEEATQT